MTLDKAKNLGRRRGRMNLRSIVRVVFKVNRFSLQFIKKSETKINGYKGFAKPFPLSFYSTLDL